MGPKRACFVVVTWATISASIFWCTGAVNMKQVASRRDENPYFSRCHFLSAGAVVRTHTFQDSCARHPKPIFFPMSNFDGWRSTSEGIVSEVVRQPSKNRPLKTRGWHPQKYDSFMFLTMAPSWAPLGCHLAPLGGLLALLGRLLGSSLGSLGFFWLLLGASWLLLGLSWLLLARFC